MIPEPAKDIFFYYAALIGLAVLLFLRRRPRFGMRLRLGSSQKKLAGTEADSFSHISGAGERPLNVVFNYNGHSWDAYEVLGLPAGSSPEKVEQSYRTQLATVNVASRPFLEAAYHAIQSEWNIFKKSKRA